MPDLVRASAVPLAEKMQYAEALASASLLPRAYQRNPGNVLLAAELGESLGIPTIQAINTVHVIEGKPSASAGLISALVRRAGHTLRVRGDDTEAVATIVRSDDPEWVFESRWTMERAKNAGLTGKDTWKKYATAMLKSRAITEVARDACQEALMGVSYTPEELGAVVDEDGNVVETAAGRPPVSVASSQSTPASRLKASVTKPKPEPVEVLEDLGEQPAEAPATPSEPMVSEAQARKISRAMDEIGCTERAAKRELAAEFVQRRLSSVRELTAAEADGLMTRLTTLAQETTPENTTAPITKEA